MQHQLCHAISPCLLSVILLSFCGCSEDADLQSDDSAAQSRTSTTGDGSGHSLTEVESSDSNSSTASREEGSTNVSGDGRRETFVEADDFFPDRRVVVNYVDGEPHGEARGYDEQDRLIFVEHYANGELHGTRICYYPSGAKFSEMTFEQGVAQGESHVYFANGVVASTIEYKDGQPHGTATTYYFNGNAWTIARYENGVLHGDFIHNRPDGLMFAGDVFENGVVVFHEDRFDVSQIDVAEMDARSSFPEILKAHWEDELHGPQPGDAVTESGMPPMVDDSPPAESPMPERPARK